MGAPFEKHNAFITWIIYTMQEFQSSLPNP